MIFILIALSLALMQRNAPRLYIFFYSFIVLNAQFCEQNRLKYTLRQVYFKRLI